MQAAQGSAATKQSLSDLEEDRRAAERLAAEIEMEGVPLHKRFDLIIAKHYSGPSFTLPGGEVEVAQQLAAARLLALVAEYIPKSGPGSVSAALSVSDQVKTLMRRVVQAGGANGGASDKARLFIGDVKGFHEASEALKGVPIFPMEHETIEAMSLRLKAESTVAESWKRIEKSCRLLLDIGLPVNVQPQLLLERPERKQAGTSARKMPPPMFIQLLENTAMAAPQESNGMGVCPHTDYVRHQLLRMKHLGRGGQYHRSRFVNAEELGSLNITPIKDTFVTVADKDKLGRLDVTHVIPYEPWSVSLEEMPDANWWVRPFVAFYSGVGFMHIDYKAAPHASHLSGQRANAAHPVTHASEWVMENGEFKCCAKAKAIRAETDVRSMWSGLSIQELRDAKLSGTHVERHMVDVLKNPNWPAEEADVMGDWTPPKDPGQPAPPAGARRKSSRSAYTPNSTVKQQVEARLRFARMLQTAFKHYRDTVGRVTWETTWDDLLPVSPPECLKRFYGPKSADEAPLVTAASYGAPMSPVPFHRPVVPRGAGHMGVGRARKAPAVRAPFQPKPKRQRRA